MNKDAYYFPHFANARYDRKLRRVRKELGIEGYAIYFMVLEVLREQKEFAYPVQDIDLLADDFGTSEAKVEAVVTAYDLFVVRDDKFFYSPKFMEYLSPYLEAKERNRINGIKGNLIKYGYATKQELSEMSPDEILRLNDNKPDLIGGESGGESAGDRNKSKEKESKVKQINYVQFVDLWNQVNECNLRVTDNKREQIRSRLRTYSEDELKTSIRNRSKDDWINGEGKKYKTNWDSFWRNDEKPERYLNKETSTVLDGGTW